MSWNKIFILVSVMLNRNLQLFFMCLTPLFFTKVLATIANYPRIFSLKITRPVNRYLVILTITFLLLGYKSITSSNAPVSMFLVGFFHLFAFYTRELLLVLIIADLILCWITLGFRLIHTSKKEVVSNMYLVYYVLVPSAPLLVYTIREYRKRKSFRLSCTYRERFLSGVDISVIVQLLILISRLAKLPVYRLHYWLPKAHVQAPTILSIILARLSLKVRLVILSFLFTNLFLSTKFIRIIMFCLVTRIYFSAITRALSVDTKVFLAYCSVSHITIRCVRLLTYTMWRFIRAWLVRLRHCLSSPLLFYLAGNMQYSTHSRNCLPAKRNKFTWCYIMLLVFMLIDLPFPPVFSFWRELSILSALFNSYTQFRILIVITLTVLLRSYEQYYTRIRRFFCSSLTAIGLRSMFILLADCIT